MTCRHDPNCSSTVGEPAWQEMQDYHERTRLDTRTPEQVAADKRAEADKIRRDADRMYAAAAKLDGRAVVPSELATPASPTPDDYEVEEVEQIDPHLVLRVRYPSCSACAYEGSKVLVILGATPVQAMKWRRIDPHFRDPGKARDAREAPSPAARFPASVEGWTDALAYARGKVRPATDAAGPSAQAPRNPVPFRRPAPVDWNVTDPPQHSHGEEPCEACACSMNRPASLGCRFSPQRANGAADHG